MKAFKIGLIFSAFVLLLTLFGCSGEAPTTTLPEADAAVSFEKDKEKEDVVVKAQTLPVEFANLTEVSVYTGDVDSDGEDERIVLATGAERDKNGEFLWNDGQNWALYIEDTTGIYVLLDKYIQAGAAYFEVADYYMSDGTVPKVSVTVTSGAGFSLTAYTFSEEKSGFVEERIYDTGSVTEAGINRRYSSYPDIVE